MAEKPKWLARLELEDKLGRAPTEEEISQDIEKSNERQRAVDELFEREGVRPGQQVRFDDDDDDDDRRTTASYGSRTVNEALREQNLPEIKNIPSAFNVSTEQAVQAANQSAIPTSTAFGGLGSGFALQPGTAFRTVPESQDLAREAEQLARLQIDPQLSSIERQRSRAEMEAGLAREQIESAFAGTEERLRGEAETALDRRMELLNTRGLSFSGAVNQAAQEIDEALLNALGQSESERNRALNEISTRLAQTFSELSDRELEIAANRGILQDAIRRELEREAFNRSLQLAQFNLSAFQVQSQAELAQQGIDIDLARLGLDQQEMVLAQQFREQQMALNLSEILGEVPGWAADVLGVPAGTGTLQAKQFYTENALRSATIQIQRQQLQTQQAQLQFEQAWQSFVAEGEITTTEQAQILGRPVGTTTAAYQKQLEQSAWDAVTSRGFVATQEEAILTGMPIGTQPVSTDKDLSLKMEQWKELTDLLSDPMKLLSESERRDYKAVRDQLSAELFGGLFDDIELDAPPLGSTPQPNSNRSGSAFDQMESAFGPLSILPGGTALRGFGGR